MRILSLSLFSLLLLLLLFLLLLLLYFPFLLLNVWSNLDHNQSYGYHARELLRVRPVSPNTFKGDVPFSSPLGKSWAIVDSCHLVSKEKWYFQFNVQYFINSVGFLSLGRAIFKKLRQRTLSNNSSKSQLRGQQLKTSTPVCCCMDWGIVGCHSCKLK